MTREILVVDDNPADVLLVRESLGETVHQSRVHSLPNAEEAIAYLRRQGKFQNTARPDLIILDLNLVKQDGHAVLMALKCRAELRQIPVVVFSSSALAADISRSYGLGANCYVTKPADLKRFFAAVRAIEEFWFGYANLPQQTSGE